jgi:chitinase
MRKLYIALGAVLLLLSPLLTAESAAAAPTANPHDIVYYQTQYDNGSYVSPLALTANNTGVTDVIVAAIHLDSDGSVHLNDNPPSDPMFTQMWADLHTMQSQGVHVLAMVGGAAQGSFQNLDNNFSTYYPLLKNLITTYNLDGVDLDVEENMSQAGIERLVNQLYSDFGSGFLITLAPVGTALSGGGNLSGFSYDQLYADCGSEISWFNAQL